MRLKFKRPSIGVTTDQLRSAFRVFKPAVEGQSRGVIVATVYSVLVAGLELARPWPIKLVFDSVIGRRANRPTYFGLRQNEILIASCVAIVVISLLIGWLSVRQAVASAVVGRKMSVRIRKRVYEHMHRLALSFHQAHRTGDLLTRLMGDVNNVRDLLFTSWLSLGGRALLFVGTAIMMMTVDPWLGLLSLAPLPLLAFGMQRSSRKLTIVTRKQRAKEGTLAAFAAETLRQIRVVKAYTAEERATRQFARDSRSTERAGGEAARIAAGMGRTAEFLTGLGLAALIYFGADRVISRTITPGDLILLVSYARTLYKPLRGLSKDGTRLSKATACAERLMDLLKHEPEPMGQGPEAPQIRGRVSISDLEVRYPSGVRALTGLSLDVEAGSLVVVNGPNGAGKSTTLSVLLRLVTPTAGTVLIDGQDVFAWELKSWRDRVAYVPQDILLFGATVRENILFGRPDATDEQIEAAARAALAHDMIERLPQGYETRLGEGGATLSGGEARRLMLARAAVRDARILLLDEPLSGLDPVARATVAKAIRTIAAGRTTFVVSHGPASELGPDLVLHVDHGRVVSTLRSHQLEVTR